MGNNKLIKILAPLTVVLIVLAIIGKKQGWFGKAVTVKVAVEKAVTRSITETITANGKIQPVKEVKITPDVSGEIVELTVREGDQVKRGQLLCRIRPDTYVSQRDRSVAAISSARARLAQSEAQFIQAELAFKRNRQLSEEKTISQSEFEQAEAAYKVAKAEVDAAKFSVLSAEASLKEAEENLTKTSIYAPIDGTVSMLLVELGERVVGTSMMTGTELMRIADLSRMEARVEVNENDITRVKEGDTAIVRIDAYLDEKFRGLVTQVANSATTTGVSADQVTNFDVRIFIMPESYSHLVTGTRISPLRPGMSVSVDIRTITRHSVVAVPIQSVTTRTDTTLLQASGSDEVRTLVFVTDEKQAFARDVKTGIQDNSFIEIISGVLEGETVVSAPFSAISTKLSDSTLVEVVSKDDLFKIK